MMDVRAAGHRVVVREVDDGGGRVGLIHVPDRYKWHSCRGEVVHVGPDARRHFEQLGEALSPGDVVQFETHAGDVVPHRLDDPEYLVVLDTEIQAIVEVAAA